MFSQISIWYPHHITGQVQIIDELRQNGKPDEIDVWMNTIHFMC